MEDFYDETEIRIEITQNDNCIKYIFNYLLLKDDFKFYHRNSINLEESNLVLKLFEQYPEIEEIFCTSNYFAISFIHYWSSNTDYIEAIKKTLQDFFSKSNKKLFNDEFFFQIKKIQDFLDDYVNPAVDMEGGRYQVYSYSLKNKLLILLPLGSCRNNPSSEIDLAQIKRIMQNVCHIELNTITTINKNN